MTIKNQILAHIQPMVKYLVKTQRVDDFKDVSSSSALNLYIAVLDTFGTDRDFCEFLLIDEFLVSVLANPDCKHHSDDLMERMDDFLFDDINKLFHIEHQLLIDEEEALAEGYEADSEFEVEKQLHNQLEAKAINAEIDREFCM